MWCEFREIWCRCSVPEFICGVRFVEFGIVVLYQKLCRVNFVKFGALTAILYARA